MFFIRDLCFFKETSLHLKQVGWGSPDKSSTFHQQSIVYLLHLGICSCHGDLHLYGRRRPPSCPRASLNLQNHLNMSETYETLMDANCWTTKKFVCLAETSCWKPECSQRDGSQTRDHISHHKPKATRFEKKENNHQAKVQNSIVAIWTEHIYSCQWLCVELI